MKVCDLEFLSNVVVPQKTNSYTPILHKDIINEFEEQAYKNNFNITHRDYSYDRGGQKMISRFGIVHEDSQDMGIQVAIANSYDKSMSAKIAVGAIVWICENGMISSSDYMAIRKHTGMADIIVNNKLSEYIGRFDEEFKKVNSDKLRLQEIEINRQTSSELIGRMFLDDKIINATQLSIIKDEMYHSNNFKEMTAWSMYNWVTEALKRNNHSMHYIDSHIKFHRFITKNVLV